MMNTKLRVSIDFNPVILPAYYRGNWVGVPLFFLPDGALDAETGEIHRITVTIIEDPAPKPLERRNSSLGWDHLIGSITAFMIPWLVPPKELKELCKRFDIPMGWVIGVSRIFRKKSAGLRREDRKCTPLNLDEWEKFIRQLRKINKKSALIAEIIWFLNTELAEGGGFVTLESVLRLTIDDISPDGEDAPNWIRLTRESFGCPSLIAHYLPDHLWNQLCRQLKSHFLFVFSNKQGVPLLSDQIKKHFKRAGKLAGIKQEVTPLCLRPHFNKVGAELCAKRAKDRAVMYPVTGEDWELFCMRIPSLIPSRGCKNIHEPLHLLNAIFYHLREPCPFRKLPLTFPPWRAVAAQYRRWSEKGIVAQIIDLRKEMEAKAALKNSS
jgi:integrase